MDVMGIGQGSGKVGAGEQGSKGRTVGYHQSSFLRLSDPTFWTLSISLLLWL